MQNTSATQRQHTLSDIAEGAGVNKRAVQGWLAKAKTQHGEVGEIIGTTRMFSNAERDILLSYQSKRQTTETPVNEPVTPTAITVIEGNHRETLANIDLNNDFDLGTLRSPLQTVQSYQDPMVMAKQILAQNQERVAAMNADLQRQQAQVNESAQAIAMVEQSNFHLMQQTLNYQMESRIQAMALNQNTTQLQQKIAIQQSLGKPSGGQSEQSQA
ncbi:hypothetical protein D0962_37800 [Leptolyngbyaceae cyanobacterium CCMR0082]|uniref:Uncharacterized protein n=1 Tax=Adonisia turfae CCMR0082 TaxID=2304604 RepID=A0A6M0SIK0_9CYAN|nr:hypothetical protein [Adonisia turfae]NEZ68408.1 hypothetical protein [Adonisia turfae CCMR0082]